MLASKFISRVSKTRYLCSNLLPSSSSRHSFHTKPLPPASSDQLCLHLDIVKNKSSKAWLRNFHFTDHRLQKWRHFSTASTESSQSGDANPNAANNPESEDLKKDENLSETPTEAGSGAESKSQSSKSPRKTAERVSFSDSDSHSDEDRSSDDLVKLLNTREEQLKTKQKELEAMQDKVLRAYAEMENVMDRTKREAESSKKFAIQGFAKGLLDVADNLGRASSHVKEKFPKDDVTNDSGGAVSLLKTLLEGVEMTEKQLIEVFKKFGVEKYDPIGEPFDPHRHNAVFQLNDASKPPGFVGAVLKVGYTLYDRVIRPAEVGVTKSSDQENSHE